VAGPASRLARAPTGAVGSANFFGFDYELQGALMRLPEIRIGSLRARDVGLLGLPEGFFRWYSFKSAGPWPASSARTSSPGTASHRLPERDDLLGRRARPPARATSTSWG